MIRETSDMFDLIRLMTCHLTSSDPAGALVRELSQLTESEITEYGGVICRIHGTGKSKRRILIASGFGVPRLTVSAVRDDGRASLILPDGIKGETLVSCAAVRGGEFAGCIEAADGEYVLEPCDADSHASFAGLSIGDRLCVKPEFYRLSEHLVCASPLAAALKCAAAAICVRSLSQLLPRYDTDIVLIPDTGGRFDRFGVAAREPDYVAAISLGTAGDSDLGVRSGDGAVVLLHDKRYSADPALAARVRAAAKEDSLKLIPAVSDSGICGGAALIAAGLSAVEIDIPMKYAGARCECADPADAAAAAEVVAALCRTDLEELSRERL